MRANGECDKGPGGDVIGRRSPNDLRLLLCLLSKKEVEITSSPFECPVTIKIVAVAITSNV